MGLLERRLLLMNHQEEETSPLGYSPKGLVFHIDALDRGDVESEWKELVSGAQLPIIGYKQGQWADKYLYMNDPDTYIEMPYLPQGSFTVESVFTSDQNSWYGRVWVYQWGLVSDTYYTYQYSLSVGNKYPEFLFCYVDRLGQNYLDGVTFNSAYKSVAVVIEREQQLKLTRYINTEKKGSISTANSDKHTPKKGFIHREGDTFGSGTFIKLYAMRIYDKVLTQSEINANYEKDMLRFDL